MPNKKKYLKEYFLTFGYVHSHYIDNKILDKDCVVKLRANSISEARKKCFDNFGNKWAFINGRKPDMSYFPRGIIKLDL